MAAVDFHSAYSVETQVHFSYSGRRKKLCMGKKQYEQKLKRKWGRTFRLYAVKQNNQLKDTKTFCGAEVNCTVM